MRFAVLSDTHGDLSRMFAAADYIRALKPDALIHLGDFCADAEAMAKELRLELHAVAGNCDAGRTTHPAVDVLEAVGARILLCHGHTYDVGETPQRLIWAAQERECTAALFGHTHRQFLEKEDGVLLMNSAAAGTAPESPADSAGGSDDEYGGDIERLFEEIGLDIRDFESLGFKGEDDEA